MSDFDQPDSRVRANEIIAVALAADRDAFWDRIDDIVRSTDRVLVGEVVAHLAAMAASLALAYETLSGMPAERIFRLEALRWPQASTAAGDDD